MEEGYRQALRDACKVITGMLGENFMDSYSGMVNYRESKELAACQN